MSKKNRKVSILGFGFSGLSAAWAFKRQGFEVEVFEKENHIGGLLQTKKTEFGLIEQAANAILLSESVQEMACDFGIQWAEKKKTAQKKWVYNDKPRRWPLSVIETVKSFVPLIKLAKSNPSLKPEASETVSEWGQRTFKNSFFVDKLLGPALQGIYAQGPKDLSANLCLKTLFDKNRVKTKGSYAPKNGMSDFFEKGLLNLESSGTFKLNLGTNTQEQGLDFDIQTLNLDSDIVIDTRPDYKNLDYISVSSVTLFFDQKDRPQFAGFGCLFASSKSVLGVLFNSDIYEGRVKNNLFSETWIVSEHFMTEKNSLNKVLEFRSQKFNISAEPIYSQVIHWPEGIPNYGLKLESFLQNDFKVETSFETHKLIKLANYSGDIGLNKILEKAVRFSKNS